MRWTLRIVWGLVALAWATLPVLFLEDHRLFSRPVESVAAVAAALLATVTALPAANDASTSAEATRTAALA